MLTAVTQMDHTCAPANPDTPEMDGIVQVQQRTLIRVRLPVGVFTVNDKRNVKITSTPGNFIFSR